MQKSGESQTPGMETIYEEMHNGSRKGAFWQ